MKYMRDLSYFGILAAIVSVLCCISTTAYASSDDELTVGVEPWFEPMDFVPGYDGQLNLEDIDLDVKYLLLPERPRFNGVPPIEHIDIGTLFDSYALSDDEPIIRISPPWPQLEPWYQPFIIVIGENDGVLEYLLPPDREILPYPPRFNGVPPIEHINIGTLFDSYYLSTNTYGIAPSFDVTSYSMERSVVAIPEPATVLFLGMGALVLMRRKRA